MHCDSAAEGTRNAHAHRASGEHGDSFVGAVDDGNRGRKSGVRARFRRGRSSGDASCTDRSRRPVALRGGLGDGSNCRCAVAARRPWRACPVCSAALLGLLASLAAPLATGIFCVDSSDSSLLSSRFSSIDVLSSTSRAQRQTLLPRLSNSIAADGLRNVGCLAAGSWIGQFVVRYAPSFVKRVQGQLQRDVSKRRAGRR